MCRVKRLEAPNWVDNSVVTKPGYALGYRGNLLYRLTQHHWGPGYFFFHQVFRAESAASFAPLILGEHREPSISALQLIISLASSNSDYSNQSILLGEKLFRIFLPSTKVNLWWNKANYISPKCFFHLVACFLLLIWSKRLCPFILHKNILLS